MLCRRLERTLRTPRISCRWRPLVDYACPTMHACSCASAQAYWSALRTVKHVGFEATCRPTGQTFAVEAQSRHRAGVLNHSGMPDPDDPLLADARASGACS